MRTRASSRMERGVSCCRRPTIATGGNVGLESASSTRGRLSLADPSRRGEDRCSQLDRLNRGVPDPTAGSHTTSRPSGSVHEIAQLFAGSRTCGRRDPR